MSITNSGGKTVVVLESSDQWLLSGSNWFDSANVSKGGYNDGNGVAEFVLQPKPGTNGYAQNVEAALVVSTRNPCHRYLQIEINDWRVEDWYRRRVTADDSSLEADYGSYDYLDIYIGLPLNDNAASYTKTFWARLGGASFETQGNSGAGIDDRFVSYHEGNMRIDPAENDQKSFIIDMAQNFSVDFEQYRDSGVDPLWAYYLSGSTRATENGIDTRPVYLPTASIGHVMFFWHTEDNLSSAYYTGDLAGTNIGRSFELTCSFHETIATTKSGGDVVMLKKFAMQRQNPGFRQYPAVTAHTEPGGTPGLTSSIEGDGVWYSARSGPPAPVCFANPNSGVKELPTDFTATVSGDACDTEGSVILSWTEATSSTGYTFYNVYVDNGVAGINPADSSTYTTKIGPIWGTCFPPPSASVGDNRRYYTGTEPDAGWSRRGENVGGSGNVGQTQSGALGTSGDGLNDVHLVEHVITGLDPSQTYRYALEAVDFCTASEIVATTASWLSTALTCSEPYYFNDDYSINYYKCLHFQYNRKNAAGTSYCPTEGVPFSYGTRGVVIRYPKTPYSGNLG